jgi:tRNA 2-selenouridine synthase
MKRLNVLDFLDSGKNHPILDVRSPGEYEQGRLPNALNLPLFTNDERVEVGTLYKQEGPLIAFKRGLDIIGPKMRQFVEFVERLNSKEVLIHCWRGGNRSQSVALLLEAAGFDVSILIGGYKSYRSMAVDFFSQPLPLIVLTGYTGSQKTEVLQALKNQGEQVVDLEGLAHHLGSAFGQMQESEQPTVEQFQNSLYEAFNVLDLNRRIWVEDESMRIGRVNLVEAFYSQKNAAPCVFLDVDRSVRVQNLVRNYRHLPKSYLLKATDKISKKLGVKETKEALRCIEEGRAEEAAEIILMYYDKRYYKSILAKEKHTKLHLVTQCDNPEEIAEELLERL